MQNVPDSRKFLKLFFDTEKATRLFRSGGGVRRQFDKLDIVLTYLSAIKKQKLLGNFKKLFEISYRTCHKRQLEICKKHILN